MESKKIFRALIIIVLLVSNIACDQVSKSVVRQKIEYNERINVLGHYIILTKVENTGAFLSLGNSIPRPLYMVLMIAIPLLVILYMIYYLIKKDDIANFVIIGVSFILGGGLGNLYDRVLFGSVTDFLFFDFVIFHTGIVNMADIAITSGFFIILTGLLLNRGEYRKKVMIRDKK
jgi:signal peptidase II